MQLNSSFMAEMHYLAVENPDGESTHDALVILNHAKLSSMGTGDTETVAMITQTIEEIQTALAEKARTIEGFAEEFLERSDVLITQVSEKNTPISLELFRTVTEIKNAVRDAAHAAGLLENPLVRELGAKQDKAIAA